MPQCCPDHRLARFATVWVASLFLIISASLVHAATYQVGSISELNTRISSAVAGDMIIVSNGVYTTTSSIAVTKVGTAVNPITIKAQTVGGVEIKGSHGFNLNSPAAYIIIQGFKLSHTNALSIASGTSHCRFSRNTIQLTIGPTNDISYINISGDDAEIDHNEMRNKSTLGEMLDIAGSGSQVARRLWVHHNYFHDFTSPGGNGAETIRWGLSGLSLSTGNGLCEYNLFVRCEGENEMISNKSSGNTYRYNTVLDCDGGEISQRHGNDCYYYGNYMRNTQGMRIYGDRHKIFSNYFESNSVAVNMGNGDGDVYAGDPLTSHDRPDDNIVVFNTFVNNDTHYEMGGRTGGLGSSNTIVANNVFQGGGNMASISSSAPYTGSWSNNIRWQTSTAGNMPASGYTNVNPLLVKDANGEYHIQSGSPAINTGVSVFDYYGVFNPLSFVTNDMDGQLRDATFDIGADEFSAAPIVARILMTNDVGPLAGLFNFNIAASPASRTIPPGVLTNVTYVLTVTDLAGSNAPVSLSISGLPTNTSAAFSPPSVTGSGSSTLTVTVSNTASAGVYTLTLTGTSTNSTNFTTVALLLARPPANLRWASTSSAQWDIAASLNWVNLSNSAADVFFQGDSVRFDDTIPGSVVTNILLNLAVTPAAVTNDSTNRSYTISGSGTISGSASLVKRGPSTLVVSTTNDFTGGVTILGGTLKAGSSGALGSSAGTTVINGGTLDINGFNFTAEPVTVSGSGAGGQGAVVNSGPQQTSGLRNVTMAGDTTFGATGRWDIRAASSSSTNGCSLVSSGQPYRITKVGPGQFCLVAVSVDPGLGDIDVKEGMFAVQTVTSQLGNPTRTLTVFPGATLELWNLNTAPLNKRVVLSYSATVFNENGNSIITGPVILTNGTSTFNVGGTSLTVSNNIISGIGGFTKTGAGTLTLRGVNTYTGPTLVNSGTVALVASGSVSSSSITVAAGTTLDVSGRTDGKLTLASGQTLMGDGTLNGSLQINPAASVSPGTSIGLLAVSSTATLQGTTLMEVNKAVGINDTLSAATITYGGTLQVTNVAGAFVDGDAFPLFSAGGYSGSFAKISPAIPALNLAWDTSTLTADGTLRIISAPTPQPQITGMAIANGNLVLAGNNGVPGWPYTILATTDPSLPLASWTPVLTNQFDASGGFSITNAIDLSILGRFYALQIR